ncbi:hypothetical protein K435DRAFT_523759 [Dendrothele bispora CBS 962.96]|uniref:Uncharacterized protein n=1 Tax=Dendrothele bispora (strain CBS 962.96) TaxID=1314807 RepID=A0A4S8KUJ3_DENBC|nr:hypothetical protein K435DRAFT_523759 [Dendrothele bispora CBS 962.96]
MLIHITVYLPKSLFYSSCYADDQNCGTMNTLTGASLPQIRLVNWFSKSEGVENVLSAFSVHLSFWKTRTPCNLYQCFDGPYMYYSTFRSKSLVRYRNIDLAMVYINQDEVGAAFNSSPPKCRSRDSRRGHGPDSLNQLAPYVSKVVVVLYTRCIRNWFMLTRDYRFVSFPFFFFL